MKYNTMPINDIIHLAQNGDKQAEEYLINNNIDIVYAKSKLFYIKGLDNEDVIQEGLIGLYKAIRDYNQNKAASFRGFAYLCVQRQLISAIKTANRQKHMPLNNSTSINKQLNYSKDDGGRGRTLLDILPSHKDNPERNYINQEEIEEIFSKLKKVLTKLELKAFNRYLQGKSYKEIAKEINGSISTVDNALYRARTKINKLKYEFEKKIG